MLLPVLPQTLKALTSSPAVMTAQCACGCWTIARVCRRSQRTGKNMMRPFMTWPSTRRSPSSPAPGPMLSPRSLFNFLTGDPPSLLGQKSETPNTHIHKHSYTHTYSKREQCPTHHCLCKRHTTFPSFIYASQVVIQTLPLLLLMSLLLWS